MLRKKIDEYYNTDADFGIVRNPFLDILIRAVESDNVTLLDNFFGIKSREYYLNQADLYRLNQETKQKDERKEPVTIEDFYRDIYTHLMNAAFYYAVSQGNLAVAKYFVEHGVTEDLDIDVTLWLEGMPLKKGLNGRPLILAVASGNLELVKYLYENTDALIEVSIGQSLHLTPLMVAVKKGDVPIMKYLLANGANPNAEKFASLSTGSPLALALDAGHSFIVQLLAENGVIITSSVVYNAIKKNVDIETIKYLISKRINRESPHHPYLLAAIYSGNVSLLKFVLSLPDVVTVAQAAECSKDFTADMVLAAVTSGNVEMLKYLADDLNLPVRECIQNDYVASERKLNGEDKPKNHHEAYTWHIIGLSQSILSTASGWLVMLRYFFEELKLVPSKAVIKEICSEGAGICETAYLLNHLEESPEQAAFYKMIALDLHQLPLLKLFQIYNSPLVLDGNPLQKHRDTRRYREFVGNLIAEKAAGMRLHEIVNLVKEDREALIGAVFYYCNEEMDKTPEKLMKLVSMLGDVNIKNAAGTPLITYAGGAKKNIVRELLNRNADPDVPDAKGMTMMNWSSNFDAIAPYARSYTNSLRYALQRSFYNVHLEVMAYLKASGGSTCAIPVADIINYLKKSDDAEKIYKVLFNYLNHDSAVEMVRLFHDEDFIKANDLKRVDDVLKIFENVDTSVISAEEKASRLRGGLSLAASSQAGKQQKLFVEVKAASNDMPMSNSPKLR